mmetsp:Transcript_21713/g.40598  ORF Transcript_21713/g.40598 Transcript_21713/m.40598 type:complete len:479 (-) Transcript_21713:152-1588(-)
MAVEDVEQAEAREDLREGLLGDEQESDDSDGTDSEMEAPLTPFSRSPVLFFREKFQAGSIKGSVFMLVVAVVGAGTLSVPFAFEQVGVLLGISMFLVGGCFAYFSLQLLIISSDLAGVKSYVGIARNLYGPVLGNLTQLALLLNLYGTSISYIVAAGSMVSSVLCAVTNEPDLESAPDWMQPRAVMIALVCCIVVPLCLMRTMGALRYSSLVAVGCSSYLAIVVMIKYFAYCGTDVTVIDPGASHNRQTVQCFWKPHTEDQEPISLVNYGMDRLLSAIPIVVYAYTCHPNVLPVFLELQKPSRRRMFKVLGRATGLSFTMYVVLGTFGYLTFKTQLEHSNGNFLNNDYHHDAMTMLGACGMSLSVILAIPLFVNAFRASFYRIIAGPDSDALDASTAAHVSMSLGMVSLALLPAILVKDISIVFQLLGSTTNPFLCYILPCLFINKAPQGHYRKEKALSILLAVGITAISVMALVQKF